MIFKAIYEATKREIWNHSWKDSKPQSMATEQQEVEKCE